MLTATSGLQRRIDHLERDDLGQLAEMPRSERARRVSDGRIRHCSPCRETESVVLEDLIHFIKGCFTARHRRAALTPDPDH
ncbi:MAG: hypothetical protein QM606_10020 [Leucobacter sp.]